MTAITEHAITEHAAAEQASTPAGAVDGASHEPFVRRVSDYAGSVLAPAALATDRTAVAAGTVADLAGLGLLNHVAPARFGGAALGRAADRRIHEILAGACLNTWLVWAQHAPLVGRLTALADAGRTSPRIDDVLAGRVLVGAGLSDIRRYPDDYIRATRVRGGWRLRGTVSWVSGWGLNTLLAVGAVDPARGSVVTGLVGVGARTVARPLALSAVAGSRTYRVDLEDAEIADDDVLSVDSIAQWRRQDLGTAGDARPHHFGLAAAVLAELDDDPNPLARAAAAAWRPRIAAIRARAYALSDEAATAGDATHRIDERLALKVTSGESVTTVARALLVARAGRGLAQSDTAQLYARNASFLLVQGQRSDVRDAQLTRLTDLAHAPLPSSSLPSTEEGLR